MLHPGYPTLMVSVQDYLQRHPEMCVLCIIDRETIVAATKFVLCQAAWFKRYEEKLLEAYKDNVWPLGADFEPHWCWCCRSIRGWPTSCDACTHLDRDACVRTHPAVKLRWTTMPALDGPMTVAETLAEFLVSTRFEDLPEQTADSGRDDHRQHARQRRLRPAHRFRQSHSRR